MNEILNVPFEYYVSLVSDWAKARNLIQGSSPKDQVLKLVQEVGELSDNVCKGRNPSDDIGDCLVVLLILAEQLDLNPVDCLAEAYYEIKDRKGSMRDGIFIKEE